MKNPEIITLNHVTWGETANRPTNPIMHAVNTLKGYGFNIKSTEKENDPEKLIISCGYTVIPLFRTIIDLPEMQALEGADNGIYSIAYISGMDWSSAMKSRVIKLANSRRIKLEEEQLNIKAKEKTKKSSRRNNLSTLSPPYKNTVIELDGIKAKPLTPYEIEFYIHKTIFRYLNDVRFTKEEYKRLNFQKFLLSKGIFDDDVDPILTTVQLRNDLK